MLKRFALLLFLAAAAWLVYPYVRDHFSSPSQKISRYVDRHIERVLGPVTAGSAHFDAHSIQKLREDLLDHARTARREEAPVYASALALCDTLHRAAKERNEVIARIKQLRTEIPMDALSYADEKRNFFIANAERGWKEKANRYRAIISENYAALRQEERLH